MFFRQSTYSSILNVTTFWKETIPFLFRSIKALYMPRGEDPVGQPNTNGFSGVGLAALFLQQRNVQPTEIRTDSPAE